MRETLCETNEKNKIKDHSNIKQRRCSLKPSFKIVLGIFMVYLLLIPESLASWAYKFVVNDGKIFVITDEEIVKTDIVEQIGEVTYYSDKEGTYSGNFSNTFLKGTKYFS